MDRMKDKLYFEEFGEKLLKIKGISKAEFARRLGIHKQNVNSAFSTTLLSHRPYNR